MNFEEYLVSKNIDELKFKNGNSPLFEAWKNLYANMHPLSFTEQQKFLLNKTRREFTLEPELK